MRTKQVWDEVRTCHSWFITSLEMNLWQHGSHVRDMLETFLILNKINKCFKFCVLFKFKFKYIIFSKTCDTEYKHIS